MDGLRKRDDELKWETYINPDHGIVMSAVKSNSTTTGSFKH